MAFYIKARKEALDYLGVTEARNNTADGNVLLWQSDLDAVEGNTIFERAAAIGGICLQASEARDEANGTCDPRPLPADDIMLLNETKEGE